MSVLILLFNFLVLVALEIVLGIDSLIFVALLATKIKNPRDSKSFVLSGMIVVLLMKLLLLFLISYISKIHEPLFSILNIDFSISSFVFILGGGILLIRAIMDLYDMYNINKDNLAKSDSKNSYFSLLRSLVVINVVLALDTVFIGLSFTDNVLLISFSIASSMILLSIIVDRVALFLNQNIAIRISALCFMIFLGMYLIIQGFGIDISKKYLYAATIFTILVEILTIIFVKKDKSITQ